MFIDMNVLKKQGKAAFKLNSLVIGNVKDSLVMSTGRAVVQVLDGYATNAYKSLIVEYLGELPKPGEIYTVGGSSGNQMTTGVEDELDIYSKYEFGLRPVHKTPVWIGDLMILQDAHLKKYAAETDLYKLFDASEADSEKEGTLGVARLTWDHGHILWRNDGMALQIRILGDIKSKAFHEMKLLDLGEDDKK